MNIKELTQSELFDLRKEINRELELYDSRKKIKVYSIYITVLGTKYFIKKENAYKYLMESIKDDFIFDSDATKCQEVYLNDAEVKEYCDDYAL